MRRFLRVVGALLLLLLVLLAVAYVLRGPLFGSLLIARLEEELGRALGGRYSIAGVEGSWFGDLAVVGLRTEEPPPGPLRRLEFGRAVVTYDLRPLLDGDLNAIRTITVSNARVEVDLTRGEGAGTADAAAPDPVSLVPERLPDIELEGDALLVTSEGPVALDGILLQTLSDDAVALSVHHVGLPEAFGPGGTLAGRLARDGRRLRWESDTPVSGFVLAEAVWLDGHLDATVRAGGSAVQIEAEEGAVRATSDAFQPAHLPAWVRERLAESPVPLDVRLAFAVQVTSFAPLAVEARASAEPFRVEGREIGELEIEGSFRDGRAVVRTARVVSEGIRVDAADLLLEPERPYLVGSVRRLDASLEDLRVFVPELDRPVRVTLRARSDDLRTVTIEEAVVAAEGLRLEGRGAATLPEDPERWPETAVEGSFTGSVVDFARAGYAMRGGVGIEGSARGRLDAVAADVRLEGTDLSVEGRPVRRLAVAAGLRWPEVELRELRVESEPGAVLLRGTVDVAAQTLRTATYEVDVSDLAGFLALFPETPAAEGSLRGGGTLLYDDWGLRGTASLEVEGLAVDGRALGGASVVLRAERDRLAVERLEARGPWGSAAATGEADLGERWARIDTLALTHERGEATLARPARVTWEGEVVRADAVELAVWDGRLTASVRRGERLELSVTGEGLDLSRADARFAGRASVKIEVAGDDLSVEARVPRLRFQGHDGELFLRVRQVPQGVRVERVSAYTQERLALEASGLLPWRLAEGGFVRVDGVEPVLDLVLNVKSLRDYVPDAPVGAASVRLRGDGPRLRGTARLRDLQPAEGVRLTGVTVVELAVDRDEATASVTSERGELGVVAGTLRLDRGVDWTRGWEAGDVLDQAVLDGRLRVETEDLGVLAKFVPDLVHVAGTGSADLRLHGPLRAPDVTGEARAANLSLSVKGSLPPVQQGSARLVFEGRTVRIEELRALLGYAPFAIEGTVELGGDEPRLDLALRGENFQIVRSRHLRVRANVDLSLTGPLSSPLAAGEVEITNALYSKPMSLLTKGARAVDDRFYLFSIREGPLAAMRFDVHVVADESVRVSNNVVRGVFSADLRLGGRGEVPVVQGRVFCRDVLVDLPLSGLKVDRGEVFFAEEDPFDPRVNVAAHTRMKGYDLDVALDGPLSDLQLHVSSRPPLGHEDAILLLTSGYTRSELEAADPTRTALGTAGALFGQQLLASVSGPRDPDARTFFDRFTFTIGKEVSRSGTETVEGEFELHSRWYLRIERDRFDEYNGGVVWRLRFK